MTIHLGREGSIELKRPTTNWLRTNINKADVQPKQNRFSVNFYGSDPGQLAVNERRYADQTEDSLYNFVTGDRVHIRAVDGSNLDWIDHPLRDSQITLFIYLDSAGGMRLYNEFAEALEGQRRNSVNILEITKTQTIEIRCVENTAWRCLGQVTSYELVSNRENIDITSLSNLYRQQYDNGIIQGSGRLSAYFQYEFGMCEVENTNMPEVSMFLASTVLRLEQGADFGARFYLHKDPYGGTQSVWYDAPVCVVTNAVVSVEPTALIKVDVDFVSHGRFRLKQGYAADRLALEQYDQLGREGVALDEFNKVPLEMQHDSEA